MRTLTSRLECLIRTKKKAFEEELVNRHYKSIKNNDLHRAKSLISNLVRITYVKEIRLLLIIGGQRCNH